MDNTNIPMESFRANVKEQYEALLKKAQKHEPDDLPDNVKGLGRYILKAKIWRDVYKGAIEAAVENGDVNEENAAQFMLGVVLDQMKFMVQLDDHTECDHDSDDECLLHLTAVSTDTKNMVKGELEKFWKFMEENEMYEYLHRIQQFEKDKEVQQIIGL